MSDDIRDIAIRLVEMQANANWLSDNKITADGVDVELIVRQAMREGMIRAADMCAPLHVADRIRAEADKLVEQTK